MRATCPQRGHWVLKGSWSVSRDLCIHPQRSHDQHLCCVNPQSRSCCLVGVSHRSSVGASQPNPWTETVTQRGWGRPGHPQEPQGQRQPVPLWEECPWETVEETDAAGALGRGGGTGGSHSLHCRAQSESLSGQQFRSSLKSGAHHQLGPPKCCPH